MSVSTLVKTSNAAFKPIWPVNIMLMLPATALLNLSLEATLYNTGRALLLTQKLFELIANSAQERDTSRLVTQLKSRGRHSREQEIDKRMLRHQIPRGFTGLSQVHTPRTLLLLLSIDLCQTLNAFLERNRVLRHREHKQLRVTVH